LGETLRPIIEVMKKWGTAYKARFEDAMFIRFNRKTGL
jgi:DNA-binding HxlR family transcriptional regulator